MSSAPHQLRARWAPTQKHPEFPLVTRSSGSQTDVRSRAFKAYRRNSYREAERWFSELPETHETLFYRGVCLYFLERNQEALSLLERASLKESRWQLPAFWFRANTLLRLNRLDEAYQLLQVVAANKSVYQEESRRLLEMVAP
jgi:tetratricopeptide (TPR) repeat protein